MPPQPSRHQHDIAFLLAHRLAAGEDLIVAAWWSMHGMHPMG